MGLAAIMRSKTLQQSVLSDLLLWIDNILIVRQWNISASSACRCVAVYC